MPFNKQRDIKENVCKSDGPDNQCTYKPLSSLTYLHLQKWETTSAFPKLLQLLMLKPFSSNLSPGWEWDCRSSKLAPSPGIPNLCNRWLPWNLILRYMHASWHLILRYMHADIEIHACQLRSMFMFFFPGQPLKDDVGKCVEAALKKYDEQKNVVWISLRWPPWYLIYIFSLIILVLGDHHDISFIFSLWLF